MLPLQKPSCAAEMSRVAKGLVIWEFTRADAQSHKMILSDGILAMQVVVPGTFMEYTSRRVLTSTWIEGEKLSQSKADNVAELVNVGVVSYLHQLLDIGAPSVLHRCQRVNLRYLALPGLRSSLLTCSKCATCLLRSSMTGN